MGAGLQCPTCGHLHPLADVGHEPIFPCGGCGRMLSVPTTMPVVTGTGPAPSPSSARADPTRAEPPPWAPAGPSVPSGPSGPAVPMGRARSSVPGAAWPSAGRRAGGRPPSYVRALIWLMAIPLGLVAAAVPLRILGVLRIDQLIDIFAGAGAGRFAVLLVLLPVWAAVTATLAHLLIESLTRDAPPETLHGPA